MPRIAILFAFLAVLGGCKKEEKPPKYEFRSDWKSLIEIRNAMCACKDPTCASAVLARKTKWFAEIATRDYKPSAVQTKDVEGITEAMNNCMVKAMRSDVDEAPSGSAAPPAKAKLPAAALKPVTVDQLIALARDFAPTQHPQHVIASIDIAYVDAEGTLDEESGSLTVVLGSAKPTDDPKRRVGVPVRPPAPPSECMQLTWTQAAGWSSERHDCIEASRPFPLCTVTEIWKRAIAKSTPGDGVAVVKLREATPRTWDFSIVDEPRKINIRHTLPDDCELALEKQ